MNNFELEIKRRNSERVENIRSNFSKGEDDLLTKEQFEEFQKSNEVYTADAVARYRNDLQKGIDSEEITKEQAESALNDLKQLKPIKVYSGPGAAKVFFAKAIAAPDNEEGESDLEKGEVVAMTDEQVDNLEKSEKEKELKKDDSDDDDEEGDE